MACRDSIKHSLLHKIDAVRRGKVASRLVFRAETKLDEGLRCTARVRGFPELVIDEPSDLGGDDAGMNPVEILLIALGTCQEIIYSAYAAVLDIPLDEVSVNVKGYIDIRGLLAMEESVPAGYQHITYETSITSSSDAKAIQRLVAMVERHCPLLDTLRRPVEVNGTVSLNGALLAHKI